MNDYHEYLMYGGYEHTKSYMDPHMKPAHPHCPTAGYMDYGPMPHVEDIHMATLHNSNYRTTIWTGTHLQTTLMSIPTGGDIGLEVHPHTDQFLRIEQGHGLAQMGPTKEKLKQQSVDADSAVFVPAGTWHNVTNTGNVPLKLYSIYAPPQHPHGTIDLTKAAGEAREASMGQY